MFVKEKDFFFIEKLLDILGYEKDGKSIQEKSTNGSSREAEDTFWPYFPVFRVFNVAERVRLLETKINKLYEYLGLELKQESTEKIPRIVKKKKK